MRRLTKPNRWIFVYKITENPVIPLERFIAISGERREAQNMEWQVQKYLLAGGTLEELTREFAIKVSHYPHLGVILLNYDQVASDMTQAICRECRALILSDDFQTIASRSFRKFLQSGRTERRGHRGGFRLERFRGAGKVGRNT